MKQNRRLSQVGIDRLIRLQWLHLTAQLAANGVPVVDLKRTLESILAPQFRSATPAVRGSLAKTITILMQTWVTVPPARAEFRDAGLKLLAERPDSEHLAIHWGMISAAYPFWTVVANQVGRLLRLQGDLTIRQVQQRVRELMGERETVSRRVRYVLRAFIDWGVLTEATKPGRYHEGICIRIGNLSVIAWLWESLLYTTENRKIFYRELLSHPSQFPFQIGQVTADQLIHKSNRLSIFRQGMSEDCIMLCD